MEEKNKAHIAFEKDNAKKENGVWIVPEEKTRILYDGRYCAVSGFIYAVVSGKYSILANVRGPGCPDFRGFWNCPCGYLERNETGQEGIQREIYEETGVKVDVRKIKFCDVQTDPETSNQGNVTLRFSVQYLGTYWKEDFKFGQKGGEEDEVSMVAWIPVCDVWKYNWAFGHKELIKIYALPRFIQTLLEWKSYIQSVGKIRKL